jgi:hypothetical protein
VRHARREEERRRARAAATNECGCGKTDEKAGQRSPSEGGYARLGGRGPLDRAALKRAGFAHAARGCARGARWRRRRRRHAQAHGHTYDRAAQRPHRQREWLPPPARRAQAAAGGWRARSMLCVGGDETQQRPHTQPPAAQPVRSRHPSPPGRPPSRTPAARRGLPPTRTRASVAVRRLHAGRVPGG